ncbi:MAG: hypothetical protein ACTSVZ_02360 [Promethearchaeota archaeon]
MIYNTRNSRNSKLSSFFGPRAKYSHLILISSILGSMFFNLTLGTSNLTISNLTTSNLTTSNITSANISENGIGSSCTIFTVAIGETVYFGNNEDYKLENAYQWYIPAQNISTRVGFREIYGAVFLGFDNNDDDDSNVDTWPQGGMNEHGLCFDANGLPTVSLDLSIMLAFPYSDYALSQVLWECRNVEEVIDWYQSHRWFSLGCQIHYADKSGDAVVVGANTTTGEWVFTRKNSTFLVSTNFNLDDPESGHYPCSRYDSAAQMLGEITAESDLNVSVCASVLFETHQEGTYATKYSNVFDPVNLDIYFNYGENFGASDKFNLLEKLTEADALEEKSQFFGITGTDGFISVNTVKIDIILSTENSDTTLWVILVFIGVLSIPMGIFIRSKIRKKNGLLN